MLGNRTSDEWIAQYATSHQHPVNRFCHTIGIPLIVVSIALLAAGFWRTALGLFVAGWVFQFVGHAFEGKPPEFLHDWRFLFGGLRWWVAKMRGRAWGRPEGLHYDHLFMRRDSACVYQSCRGASLSAAWSDF